MIQSNEQFLSRSFWCFYLLLASVTTSSCLLASSHWGVSLDILRLLSSGRWIRKQPWKPWSINMFTIISFRCFPLIFTQILFKIYLVIMSTVSPRMLMGSYITISNFLEMLFTGPSIPGDSIAFQGVNKGG